MAHHHALARKPRLHALLPIALLAGAACACHEPADLGHGLPPDLSAEALAACRALHADRTADPEPDLTTDCAGQHACVVRLDATPRPITVDLDLDLDHDDFDGDELLVYAISHATGARSHLEPAFRRYRIAGLEPGLYDLRATVVTALCEPLPAGELRVAAAHQVAPSSDARPVVLEVEVGASIRIDGHLELHGSPEDRVHFATRAWALQLVPAGAPLPPTAAARHLPLAARVASDGSFAFDALPGTYDLYAVMLDADEVPAEGCIDASVEVYGAIPVATAVELTEPVTLALDARPIVVHGVFASSEHGLTDAGDESIVVFDGPTRATVHVALDEPFAAVLWPGAYELCYAPPWGPCDPDRPLSRFRSLELTTSTTLEPLVVTARRVQLASVAVPTPQGTFPVAGLTVTVHGVSADGERRRTLSFQRSDWMLLPPGLRYELELEWPPQRFVAPGRAWLPLEDSDRDLDLGVVTLPPSATLEVDADCTQQSHCAALLSLDDPIARRRHDLYMLASHVEVDALREKRSASEVPIRVVGGVWDVYLNGVRVADCVPLGAWRNLLRLTLPWRRVRFELPAELDFGVVGVEAVDSATQGLPLPVPLQPDGDALVGEVELLPGRYVLTFFGTHVMEPRVLEVR